MDHITASDLRRNLARVFDRIADDREPVAVSRAGGREVIILDGDDYRSIIETLHLVSNPANAERLRKGMTQHQEGQRKVVDVEAYVD
ncbi:MAG: type II toxin-antitoxin system Phd/YefM family antitoxin [Gammaproteobacteria bacterium]